MVKMLSKLSIKGGTLNEENKTFNSAAGRADYTKILDLVARGEHVILTRYNLPVAVVVPVADAKRLEQLKASEKKSEK
jgi:prevent-host-death family protein